MLKDHIDIVNYTAEPVPLILLSSEALYRDGTGGPSLQTLYISITISITI